MRLEDRLRQDKEEITNIKGVNISQFKYAIYAGGENLGLASSKGHPSVICESEAQAKYMCGFWAPYSHYEKIDYNN
jgi:hypothetical protein